MPGRSRLSLRRKNPRRFPTGNDGRKSTETERQDKRKSHIISHELMERNRKEPRRKRVRQCGPKKNRRCRAAGTCAAFFDTAVCCRRYDMQILVYILFENDREGTAGKTGEEAGEKRQNRPRDRPETQEVAERGGRGKSRRKERQRTRKKAAESGGKAEENGGGIGQFPSVSPGR